MNLPNDPLLKSTLDRLHSQSKAQDADMGRYFSERARAGTLSWDGLDADANRFLSDKLVALEPIKAEFCYLLCRSLDARRVVEVGTSFGVSTLYLAAAVRENDRASGHKGTVIGTEYEPAKAAQARENFRAAGLADYIDLREGDLRQTLRDIGGSVDFVLMDIWTEMARPAIELIGSHLRRGAIVVCDNTASFRDSYRHFFDYVNDPRHGFSTMTLPFDGGLEVCVRC